MFLSKGRDKESSKTLRSFQARIQEQLVGISLTATHRLAAGNSRFPADFHLLGSQLTSCMSWMGLVSLPSHADARGKPV